MNGPERLGGFTLMEMLIVIMILGVLSVILLETFGNQVQATRLQNAVTTFSTDLEKARSAAWKSGKSVTLAVLSSKLGYTYTVSGKAAQTVNFTDGIAFKTVGTVTYTPPFADVAASSNVFTLASPNPNLTADVRVIGVTGQVVR